MPAEPGEHQVLTLDRGRFLMHFCCQAESLCLPPSVYDATGHGWPQYTREVRMGARLIKATENIIAAIVRLFRWWFGLIVLQDTLRGKAIVACVGLLALCVVCSLPVALVNGPKKPAAVVASVPSVRPTTVEQAPPMASATTKPTSVSPTDTPLPTSTPEPSTATPEPITKPTAVPTEKPQPTAEPAPPQAIVATVRMHIRSMERRLIRRGGHAPKG